MRAIPNVQPLVPAKLHWDQPLYIADPLYRRAGDPHWDQPLYIAPADSGKSRPSRDQPLYIARGAVREFCKQMFTF